MKIAMIQPRISYYNGGGEKNPMKLILELTKHTDIKVELYTLKLPDNKSKNYFEFKNKINSKVNILELPVPNNYKYLYEIEPGQSRYRWNTESLYFNSLVIPRLLKSSYDILWSFYNYDGLIHPLEKPSILNLLGYPHTKVPHEEALIDQFTATVSISSNVARMWEKQLGTKLKNNYITPPAVEMEDILENRNFFTNTKYNIVYAGRLIERKGLETLLRSFPNLIDSYQDITLHILGEGPFEKRIREITKEIEITDKVKLHGYKENISEFLVNASACVFPSLEGEGLMGTVLETMHCGGVVITTTGNGNEEIIDNNINGIIIKPNNTEILSNTIQKVLDDPDFSKNIRTKAKTKARNDFTWKNQVNEIERIIEKVMYDFSNR